jgi:hypothetical protein
MLKRAFLMLVAAIGVFTAVQTASADVYVHGYYRSNGTYVQPHYRSDPDGNFWNNWSTYPNVNPYTGSVGTRHSPSYNYGGSGSYSYPSYSYPSYSPPSYRSYNSYGTYNLYR